MAVQNTQTGVFTTRNSLFANMTTHNCKLLMDYKDPDLQHASPASPTLSSAIIQISATFYNIYLTIFERFRASTNQSRCLPPPSRPRLPTPQWEPTTGPTASSCKLVSPGSVFALQTGSSNNSSERWHNYF